MILKWFDVTVAQMGCQEKWSNILLCMDPLLFSSIFIKLMRCNKSGVYNNNELVQQSTNRFSKLNPH